MRIDQLAPVHLDELNATAGLMARVDRKYPLNHRTAETLIDLLPEGTRVLEIDGRHRFGYTSVYFDTTARHSYLMAARGRAHRFKVRVRHYRDSGDAFLEVKTRKSGSTIKQRVEHDANQLFSIDPDHYSFITECLQAGGVYDIKPQWLRPALETSYTRTTLLAPDGSSRLTLDQDLVWTENGQVLRAPRLAVIETKSGSAAGQADKLLWRHGIRPQRMSKFATGLAALHPELPANRWHRTMQRHFCPSLTR